MPAQADNPDGFWENLRFVALNDEVLNELGGAWDLPPPANEDFENARLDPLRVKAQLLTEGFDPTKVWGWKDPRNSLTLPFWRQLLPELKVIVMVRNPLEVAYSMRTRNGTSYSFGLRLWEMYNRRLLESTKVKQRLITHYDSFFENPELELQRIASFMGLPSGTTDHVAEIVTTTRRHTQFSIDQLIDARAPTELVDLYRHLTSQAQRAGAKFVVRHSGKRKSPSPDLLPGSVSRLNASIPEAETTRREMAKLRHADVERQRLQSEVQRGAEELARREGRLIELDSQVRRQEQTQVAVQRQLLQLNTTALRLEQECNALENQLQTSGGAVARLEQERNSFREQSRTSNEIIAELRTQEEQLCSEIRDLSNSLETARFQLTTKQSEKAELTSRAADLEGELKQFADAFGLTPERLRENSSPAVVLISSLFRKIRLIQKRTFWWKTSRSLIPNSDANSLPNPKVTADTLKQQLLDIKRTLKSKKTSAAAALSALSKLIALETATDRILASLKAKSLFQPKQNSGRTPGESPILAPTSVRLSALFDSNWYLRKYPDVAQSGIDPLHHYLTRGGQQGRDPHLLFDTNWYLSQTPELKRISVTPLEHYILHGAKEGRSPHPQWDAQFYVKNNPTCVADDTTPLEHYLTVGWKLGHRPNPHFDPDFYLRVYTDVAAAGVEPLTHFLLAGEAEGRMTCEDRTPFQLCQPTFNISSRPMAPLEPFPVARAKAIAFYLPQFHPIPENDMWWGDGFTEWSNVRMGRPNFAGHYQPHVPQALGYYDLRDATVLQKQMELASAHGIHGFCFYYYWFGGKVLLDLPVRVMLESGKPDVPFCICWANENWTRRWDGLDSEILISQNHSPEDDLHFIRQIESILLHKRYIRVRGKPMLLVYRPSLFPNSFETTERWRDYFRRQGHGELHLTMVRSFYDQTAPKKYGFDAAVQFPPHFATAPITHWVSDKDDQFTGDVHDYIQLRKLALEQLALNPETDKTYAGVMPSWDNTARRGSNAVLWVNSSPEAYYEWVCGAVAQVEQQADPDDRLIFINAWNEWAEGCHLEPDEKYGYAWLNATALALSGRKVVQDASDSPPPTPPVRPPIDLPALKAPLKLAISVLFYHREDLIAPFLESILPQISTAEKQEGVTCSLNLAFNYRPSDEVRAQLDRIIAGHASFRPEALHIFENGFNLGFGAGHNLIFAETDSDIFLILNSDIRIQDEGWLGKVTDRFLTSKAAIIGLTQTASRLRDDGCGIPLTDRNDKFDFVDGSALALRSDLVRQFGLFSPVYDYFYFEDADLCLRYRQIGLEIELLDVAYEHERSSSSRLLPQFAVEAVLNRNRARFFERWGKYLQTRTLSNRIGLCFREANRHLQCASLPSVLAILSEHRTAIVDVWGVHEQLSGIFKHPRLRLIPSWQTLRKDDYLRYYELVANESEIPCAYQIARQIGCEPDFEAAHNHLQSLIGAGKDEASSPKTTALIYIDRKQPFFDGKQPSAASLAAVAAMLRSRAFDVQLFTNYGTFEIQDLVDGQMPNCNCAALTTGLTLLESIAAASLVVTSDSWISELAQLLQKQTFVWLGAISSAAAIWEIKHTGYFVDQSLECLGCYHRFGRGGHNLCLRGDLACVRNCLTGAFTLALEEFLDGNPFQKGTARPLSASVTSSTRMPSRELSLDQWPKTTAASVLALTPISPHLEERILARAQELVHRALKGMGNSRVVYDSAGEAPPRGAPFPHRLAGITPLRQAMIDRHLRDEQWVFWVDADLVEYPAELIHELIYRAEGGIAAPLVIMEGDPDEPAFPAGFGPGRFYDIAGFIEQGRWTRFTQPFFDQRGPVYQLDSVGCCYLVNADLYRRGAKHELDPASSRFIAENRSWPDNAIEQNQAGPANSFSDHYTVCAFARQCALPVRAFGDLVAYHQKV